MVSLDSVVSVFSIKTHLNWIQTELYYWPRIVENHRINSVTTKTERFGELAIERLYRGYLFFGGYLLNNFSEFPRNFVVSVFFKLFVFLMLYVDLPDEKRKADRRQAYSGKNGHEDVSQKPGVSSGGSGEVRDLVTDNMTPSGKG